MAMISALWTRRSTRATRQAALGKASLHSAKGRLVVTTVERCWLRLETILKSRSAWRLLTDDGWAEGCRYPDRALVGVMWHPERHHPFREFDRALVRRALGGTVDSPCPKRGPGAPS